MAYDENLASRIRSELSGTKGLTEKKMFGGIGWMVNGHLAAGAHSDGNMMIRCSKDDYDSYVKKPGAGPLMRGQKGMMGWVIIDAKSVKKDADLIAWVKRGKAFAEALPAK